MSWKVSPKKVMVTLLLIMITVYHSMTMLYYISGMDSSFLEKRYIIGTATMILAIFIIAVFKLHRYLKMPLGRFSELSSDGGSGRNIVWAKVLASFSNSDLKRKIFGHGINSVFQTVTICPYALPVILQSRKTCCISKQWISLSRKN